MAGEVQPEELTTIFRENLIRRRNAVGLTQPQLAKRINDMRNNVRPLVHAPYISDLETGKRTPRVDTLALLADALDTTPEALLAAPKKLRIAN